MAVINLKGYEVIVDDECRESITKLAWYARVSGNGRVYFTHRGCRPERKDTHLHHFVLGIGSGLEFDHINGNTLDNRKCNLRICTHSENMMNKRMPKHNTSGRKGVGFHKLAGKWRADISVNRKRIYLGLFADKEQAYQAYCEAVKKLHGEFARFE